MSAEDNQAPKHVLLFYWVSIPKSWKEFELWFEERERERERERESERERERGLVV